jgi:hypothetical protein
MSVIHAGRLWNERGGGATADERRHTEVWEVITDDEDDDQEVILASGQIPSGYASHPNDPAARLAAFRFLNHPDDPTYWIVYCEYSTRQPPPGVAPTGGASGSPQENYVDDPVLKPAQVSIRTETVQIAIEADLDGNPIRNLAGTPYATQTIDDNGLILSLQKNRALLPLAILRLYRNAVNSDVWYGIPAGHAKILSLRADAHFDKERFYWAFAGEIFIADDEWIERYGPLDMLRLVNKGPEYVSSGGVRKRFLVEGQLGEGYLEPDGTRSADGAEPNYIDFRVKPRRPFAALGLYP